MMVAMRTDIELGGVAEIAEELGLPRTTVSMWDARRSEVNGYPEPVARLASGPIFDMAEIRRWWAARQAKAPGEMIEV
jgi:hypothetical protein